MPEFYFTFGKPPPTLMEKIFSSGSIWIWLDPLLDWLTNLFNKNILKRIDGASWKRIFDELDIFWLRNSNNKYYRRSDVRLIISMFISSIADQKLTRKELLAIVEFVIRKWSADIALSKELLIDEVIEARVEATVDQAIQLYEKMYMEKPLSPEEFVLSTAEIIYHEPDGSEAQALLGGTLQIRNKLIF
jgi:hypothetical protein